MSRAEHSRAEHSTAQHRIFSSHVQGSIFKCFIQLHYFYLQDLLKSGGYLIWLWLREGKPYYWGIFGGVALALYGGIATFQTFPSFDRVYAAYGGVFIVLSVLWGGY